MLFTERKSRKGAPDRGLQLRQSYYCTYHCVCVRALVSNSYIRRPRLRHQDFTRRNWLPGNRSVLACGEKRTLKAITGCILKTPNILLEHGRKDATCGIEDKTTSHVMLNNLGLIQLIISYGSVSFSEIRGFNGQQTPCSSGFLPHRRRGMRASDPFVGP